LRAAYAIGSAFAHIPDKRQAWNDLIRLTQDKNWDVRRDATNTLGSVFPHILDKEQVWNDLIRLTQDEDRDVRMYTNHSLGRASISNANETENEEDFREELKNALEFFERSSKESPHFGPSNFCLPFYRSFYTITFEKAGGDDKVQNYLAKAKWALGGSKNKETLLEAVESLANALSEAQKVTDFNTIKSDLDACRQYCDRAADLIGDAAEGAPGAARVLRRGLPIIDDRIKEIIRKIQEKARAVCRDTQETPLEELGLATAKSAQELPTQDPLALTMALGSMASIARGWCEYLPTDKKVDACEQLKNLPGMELSEQGAAIARVFEYVQENIHIPKIQTVHVSETEYEIVRIAIAQISFELTESFPFTVKGRDDVKTKIFSALEISRKGGANIVCLPELCICGEWISEIEERYPDMIVIGGSFYKDNKNICPVIMESDADTPYQPKITPSPFEDGIMGPRMIPGDRIYRYETRFGKFAILICMDFDDLAHFFRESDIDMIFCPSSNSANERFHNEAHSHVERTPSYILIANTGLYGGTSIFGQLNNKYFGELADRGCKEREDSTYKLCEVKEGQEEVIIADFNLNHKGAQVPIPSNPNKVIKSVDHIRKIPI
jgi:predicted amidohydrolase